MAGIIAITIWKIRKSEARTTNNEDRITKSPNKPNKPMTNELIR